MIEILLLDSIIFYKVNHVYFKFIFLSQLLAEHYQIPHDDICSEHRVLSGLLSAQYNTLETKQVLQVVQQVHQDTMPTLANVAAAIAVIPVSTAGICTKQHWKNLAISDNLFQALEN